MKVYGDKYTMIPDGVIRHTELRGVRLEGVRLSHQRLEGLVVTCFGDQDGNLLPDDSQFSRRSLLLLEATSGSAQKIVYPTLSHGPAMLDFLTDSDRHQFGRMCILPEAIRTFKASDAVLFGRGAAAATMARDSSVMLLKAEDVAVEAHLPWRGVASVNSDGTGNSTVFMTIDRLVQAYKADPKKISMIVLPGIRGCCLGFNATHPTFGPNNQRLLDFVREWNETPREPVYRNEDETSFDIPSIAKAQAMSLGVKEENILVPDYCVCCGAVERDGELTHPFYSHTRSKALGDEYGAKANASNVGIGWLDGQVSRDLTF